MRTATHARWVPPEEGSDCRDDDCSGTYEYPPVENCACHISPPCSQCTSNELECNKCGDYG